LKKRIASYDQKNKTYVLTGLCGISKEGSLVFFLLHIDTFRIRCPGGRHLDVVSRDYFFRRGMKNVAIVKMNAGLRVAYRQQDKQKICVQRP
jgi:hypothetical protein